MKEFEFEQLKNIEIEFPESWVENALNSPEEKRRYVIPQRFYYIAASAAAFVIIAAAVTLSMILGIGKDVDLIEPNPDPSQADYISGGVLPDTTNGSFTSGIPPVYSAEDSKTATALTEPSENGNTKSNRQGTASANGKSKTQSSDVTKAANKSSKQKPVSPGIQSDSGENESQAPDVQEPTDIEPEPFDDTTNEPWEETKEPAPPCEFNYTLTATVESSLAQGDIYCRVTDKNGTTFGIGGLFDKTRLAQKYDAGSGNTSLVFDAYNRPAYYGRMEFGESYNVIFYNAKGETIRQGWVTVYYDEYYSI